MATADLPKDSKPHRPVVPGNTALGKTCSTRPAESLVSLAVRLWLANALVCLSLYVRRRLSDCLLCRWLTLLLWRLPRKSVGANIVRPSIFSYSGKRYPRSHFRNPSGGIARFSRCPPWACKRFCLPFLVCAVLIFRVFVLGMVFALIQRLLRLFLFCFPVRN